MAQRIKLQSKKAKAADKAAVTKRAAKAGKQAAKSKTVKPKELKEVRDRGKSAITKAPKRSSRTTSAASTSTSPLDDFSDNELDRLIKARRLARKQASPAPSQAIYDLSEMVVPGSYELPEEVDDDDDDGEYDDAVEGSGEEDGEGEEDDEDESAEEVAAATPRQEVTAMDVDDGAKATDAGGFNNNTALTPPQLMKYVQKSNAAQLKAHSEQMALMQSLVAKMQTSIADGSFASAKGLVPGNYQRKFGSKHGSCKQRVINLLARETGAVSYTFGPARLEQELMPIVVGKPYANCAEDEKAFFRSEYHSAMSHVQSKALVDTRNATISKLLVEFLLPPIEKPRSENPPFLHIHVSKFDELLKPVKGVDPTDPQYARFSAWHADFDASNKLMCFQKRE